MNSDKISPPQLRSLPENSAIAPPSRSDLGRVPTDHDKAGFEATARLREIGNVTVSGSGSGMSTSASVQAELQPRASTVRRSLLLSFSEKYVSLLIQVLATAVLARLLSPADYGVYGVALVIVSIITLLRDFGAISFIMQERDLTEDRLRTVYGVSLVIGIVAGGAIAGASGSIANF